MRVKTNMGTFISLAEGFFPAQVEDAELELLWAGINQPHIRLCVISYVTLWCFRRLNRPESRFVFLNVVLQSTYHSLH
jgi:hypothetical protein